MNNIKKTFLQFILIIGLVSIVGLGASNALFSDSEFSIGNLLGAAEGFNFDLLVNGQNDPTGIVTLADLKPGDDRNQDKIVRVNSSSEAQAKVYLHLKDLVATPGAQTEPEIEEENGTPKSDIHNYLTYDLTIGGETLIDYADLVLLPSAVSCWIPLGTIDTNTDVVVNQSFHFDPTVTNWAQGDALSWVEDFLALSVDAPDPGVPYGSDRLWNPQSKTCINCTRGSVWAATVVSANQGTRKDGSTITDPARTNPANALGAADWVSGTGTNFFSLGKGGTITLGFATAVFDVAGPDLSFHEVTNGRTSYPLESAHVEISFNGSTWYDVGDVTSEPSGDGVMYLDISTTPLSMVKFVRITDTTDFALHQNDADGFDLDAVDGVSGCLSIE